MNLKIVMNAKNVHDFERMFTDFKKNGNLKKHSRISQNHEFIFQISKILPVFLKIKRKKKEEKNKT